MNICFVWMSWRSLTTFSINIIQIFYRLCSSRRFYVQIIYKLIYFHVHLCLCSIFLVFRPWVILRDYSQYGPCSVEAMALNPFTYSDIPPWTFAPWPICLDQIRSRHTGGPWVLTHHWSSFQSLTYVTNSQENFLPIALHGTDYGVGQILLRKNTLFHLISCLIDSFATGIYFPPG